MTINNSTVSGNFSRAGGSNRYGVTGSAGNGGGIFVNNSAANPSLTIENSVIANNSANSTAPDLQPDLGGTLTVSHSLIGATDLSISGTGNQIGTLASPIDPLLGPLADNGGPTLTHALLPGSPAIDAGDPSFDGSGPDGVFGTEDDLPFDQRGIGYSRINIGTVDIGAFESVSSVAAPTVVSATIDEGGVLERPDLWNKLAVVFDTDVTVTAGDLSLVNDSTGGVSVDLTGIGFSYNSQTLTGTWDFTSLAPLDAAFYTYRLDAGSITAAGQALDGNGDGTGGDDFEDQHYVAIPGDLNLDGDVDVSQIVFGPGGVQNVGDASILLANLPTASEATYYDGDLNGDGDVDVTQIVFGPDGVRNVGDASILLANLGRAVVPPAASVLSSTAANVLAATRDQEQPEQVRQNFAERLGQWESEWHQTVRQRLAVATLH